MSFDRQWRATGRDKEKVKLQAVGLSEEVKLQAAVLSEEVKVQAAVLSTLQADSHRQTTHQLSSPQTVWQVRHMLTANYTHTHTESGVANV